MDPVIIIAIIIIVIIAYLLLSGNTLDKAFDNAVTKAEMSCATAIKSQLESDFDNAIAAITTAKTAQSASLGQYSQGSIPASVNAISKRLDAIHCGNHTADKKAVDAIATATAANEAANKSGSPEDIQTAISTRDIALRSIKAALDPYGTGTTYVTAALNSAITAFKALDYKNEDNDKAFIDSVTAASDSCSAAISSQDETDFTNAIQKIAIAKTNKLISISQYSEANTPLGVKNAVLKLNGINCGLHVLDKAAITAIANAVASCATANASKLPSDIQVALNLRSEAQKALANAIAQYSNDTYVTAALATSINSFKALVYNNMVVDKDFIDAVDAADSSCGAAMKSNSEADFTANLNQIATAKAKQAVVIAQYTGFTLPQAVSDAVAKLTKISCATRAIDKNIISAVSSALNYFKTAMSAKTANNLYYAGIYYYYVKFYAYQALAAYKSNGYSTTSSAYDDAMKTFNDLDWASFISYCIDAYVSGVDKAVNSCTAAKTSQAAGDFNTAQADYDAVYNIYYAIYYYYYGNSYPNGFSLPTSVSTANSKILALNCKYYASEIAATNAINTANTACAGTDVAAARKAYSSAAAAVRTIISNYGSSTNYATTALVTTMDIYNGMSCSVANPFTFTGSISTSNYLYIYVNNALVKYIYPSSPISPVTVSIPKVVPGDVIRFYIYRNNSSDPIGFIGSWNNSSGGTVSSNTTNLKVDSANSPSGVTINDISIFPSGKLDLSAIASKFSSDAKWVSPATDGYTTSIYYLSYNWIAV